MNRWELCDALGGDEPTPDEWLEAGLPWHEDEKDPQFDEAEPNRLTGKVQPRLPARLSEEALQIVRDTNRSMDPVGKTDRLRFSLHVTAQLSSI